MTNNKEYARKHRETNRKKYAQAQRKYSKTDKCKKINNIKQIKYRNKLKKDVMNAYGNKCSCCGETEPLFLEIDHVYNDGYKDKKGYWRLLSWIRTHKYPDVFQILCSNCNRGKYRNGGVCPHKKY
jgi:hypothetical protein